MSQNIMNMIVVAYKPVAYNYKSNLFKLNDTEKNYRSSRLEVFFKKIVLKNFAKLTCARVSSLMKLQTEVWNFIKKETLA